MALSPFHVNDIVPRCVLRSLYKNKIASHDSGTVQNQLDIQTATIFSGQSAADSPVEQFSRFNVSVSVAIPIALNKNRQPISYVDTTN
ncbi:unnamed protein product [Cylicostephanus goldi]|uniref:Uncharacterized protein n=1 Tax=Cylicostephanus goldi TaxID=71465 RepID=A0A3P6RCZ8_CYLGO|nr:unnamed protein product [Cylicostephanus goldi]